MNIGVHATHCCHKHGCKYGDEDCPVVSGQVEGIICEDCEFDLEYNQDTVRLDFFEQNESWFHYSNHPSMCGRYPCWIVWTPKYGRTERKTLREAIDAAMEKIGKTSDLS